MDTSSKNKKSLINLTSKEQAQDSSLTKLADNFYQVDFAAVIVETPDADESDSLKFVNPRSIDSNVADSIGFGVEDMEQLKESIRTKGLLNPLMGRIKEVKGQDGVLQKVSLINGHRRYAAIGELLEADAPCFDPVTRQTVNAKSLYKQILFKIFDAQDDFECYILAFEEDRTKVKFGSGTEAKFVQHCRSRMIPDDQILKMTGNSPEWLQNTYSLIDSLINDEVILNHWFNCKIDRGLTKHLSSIENVEERHEKMYSAISNAQERYNIKLEKINASIESKIDKIEVLSASKACDEFAGRIADADEKQARIEELEEEVGECKKKRTTTGGRAGKADLKKFMRGKEGDADSDTIPATHRISVKWPEFFKKIVQNGGALPENEDVIMPEVLSAYSIALLKAVEDSKGDQGEFMTQWISKFKASGLKND